MAKEITDLKMYREAASPTQIWIWVEWRINGALQCKCFEDNDDGLVLATEYARKIRDFKYFREELEF